MSGEADLRIFSHEHVMQQLQRAEFRNGYYVLEFYADERGRPSREPTERVARFYLYPSGGTIRDEEFQLLFYDSRYDTYRGFRAPERKK